VCLTNSLKSFKENAIWFIKESEKNPNNDFYKSKTNKANKLLPIIEECLNLTKN